VVIAGTIAASAVAQHHCDDADDASHGYAARYGGGWDGWHSHWHRR
jgi:hypothetical protein